MLECLIHGLVDHRLCSHIDVGCGLVHKHNLSWLQYSTANAHQLPLTNTQVLSIFGNLSLQPFSGVEGLF